MCKYHMASHKVSTRILSIIQRETRMFILGLNCRHKAEISTNFASEPESDSQPQLQAEKSVDQSGLERPGKLDVAVGVAVWCLGSE